MKFHNTLVEKLVSVYEINSGWTEEKKLKEALRKMNLMIYKQQSGESVIIDADQYNQMILDKKEG